MIFGSLFYKHVPEQIRRKLDDRGQSMILVGYHYIGVYKLFSPNENKVVIMWNLMKAKDGNGYKFQVI